MQNISSTPLWRPHVDHTENSGVQDTTSLAPVHPPTNIELKKEELLSLTAGKDIYWPGVASYLKTSGTNRVDVITHWVDSNPGYNLYDFLTAIAHTSGGNNQNVAKDIRLRLEIDQLSHHKLNDRFNLYTVSKHAILPIITPLDVEAAKLDVEAAKKTLKIRARKTAPHTQKPYTKRTELNSKEVLSLVQFMTDPETAQDRKLWSKFLQSNIASNLWQVIGATFMSPRQLEEINQYVPLVKTPLRTEKERIKMEIVCNRLCVDSNFPIETIIEKLHKANSALSPFLPNGHQFNIQILSAISELKRIEAIISTTKTYSSTPTKKITFIPPEPLTWTHILNLMPSHCEQDIASLKPVYQEYYFYLTLNLLPGCWSHLANTFMTHNETLKIASLIYGRRPDRGSTSYARLHKVCMEMFQKEPTKDAIIEHLKTALNHPNTPKLYHRSLQYCESILRQKNLSTTTSLDSTATNAALKIGVTRTTPHTQKTYGKETVLSKVQPEKLVPYPLEQARNRDLWYNVVQSHLLAIRHTWADLGRTFLSPDEISHITEDPLLIHDDDFITSGNRMRATCKKLCIEKEYSVEDILTKLHKFKENESAFQSPYIPHIMEAIVGLERIQTIDNSTGIEVSDQAEGHSIVSERAHDDEKSAVMALLEMSYGQNDQQHTPIQPQQGSAPTTTLPPLKSTSFYYLTATPKEAQNRMLWYNAIHPHLNSIRQRWYELGKCFLSDQVLEDIKTNNTSPKNHETLRKRMDAVCKKLCHTESFSIQYIIKTLNNFGEILKDDYSNSFYITGLTSAVVTMENIQKMLAQQATPEKKMHVVQHKPQPKKTVETVRSVVQHDPHALQEAQSVELTDEQKKYHACLISCLIPKSWSYIANTFMSSEEIAAKFTCISGHSSNNETTSHARLDIVCRLLVQKYSIDSLKAHLKKLTDDLNTPTQYIPSIKHVLSKLHSFQ